MFTATGLILTCLSCFRDEVSGLDILLDAGDDASVVAPHDIVTKRLALSAFVSLHCD